MATNLTAYNAINHQLFAQLTQKGKVLYMYRSILRMANGWDDPIQKEDIKVEARYAFHKYMNLTEPEEINDRIEEARTRMLTALHYRIPYEKKKYAIPKTSIMMKPPPDPKDESGIC